MNRRDGFAQDFEIAQETLTLAEIDRQQIEAIIQRLPGGAKNLQDIYPLSPLQEGMLFQHLMDEQSDTYVLSILFELQMPAQLGALINALQAVINRHAILRSAIVWENVTRSVLVVSRHATLPVEKLVLDQERDPFEQLKAHMCQPLQGFDLRRAPLLRLEFATDSRDRDKYAVLRVHHLVCDHQSLSVLVAEAMACIQGHEQQLGTPSDYRDYVLWTRARARANDAEAFFRRKLQGIEETTAPFGLLQVHRGSIQVYEAYQELDPVLARNTRTQAQRLGVSAARLFHAAWGLLVAKTSGRGDVVYGTVMLSERQRSAREPHAIGMFVNTLPLTLRLQGVTIRELVEQTHRELTELRQYEMAPLTLALKCSGIASAAPLFTSLLNYRRSERSLESMSAAGVRLLARSDAWTNYPVTLMVDDLGVEFAVTAKTDGRIDPHRLIRYLHTALQSLVEGLENAPQTPALALSILPVSERRQVIELFNATQVEFPQDKLIHELFEEQVERTPNAIAVTYEEHSLTYSALNGRANQLARYLRNRGVGPDNFVGLCLERSVEVLVGLLGVLKAGGAYIPLDPNNPIGRLEHLLTDAQPAVLLVQERLRSVLPPTGAEVVTIDAQWYEIANERNQNLDASSLQLSPQHLAYVIYTSGSTGAPKGVMVSHRNIVNYVVHAVRKFDVASGDGSLIGTSISFDLMLTGLYPVLLCGRTVRLCREHQGFPALEEALLRVSNLAPMKLTPSHLALLERPLRAGQLVGRIRVLMLGGEQLYGKAVQAWRAHAPGTRIFNHYGPTETTVGCVAGEIGEQVLGAVPIGRPISNTQIFILDRHRRPVPIGVIGEIYVGGAGVARGYLKRPELTAERFVGNPFSADPQARMYKTGDLGRWREDGTIECLGRNDNQVKIRGHRIELGEIEAQLLRHERIREAVVVPREDAGETRLVAYVTPAGQIGSSAEDLAAYLKPILPDYMIPSSFVILERLPLTPNGKLNRGALPVPESGGHSRRNYEAPQGEAEQILAGIWQSLLRVEQVGRHDNFFALGGHSLLIVQMMERVRALGLTVEARKVFETPTLVDLAAALSREAPSQQDAPPNGIPTGCTAITPQMLPLVDLQEEHIDRIVEMVPGGAANVQDIYPLTPLQDGILFHHLLVNEHDGDTYVVVRVLSVSSRRRLDQLIAALQAVIDRHDILRTAVLWEHLPQPVQVVCRHARLPIEEIAFHRDGDTSAQIKAWIKPDRHRLDLRRAPLLRLQVAADRNGHWYALLKTHHIALDHMTFGTAIAEVVAHLEGRAQILPEPAPYRIHVANALAYSRTHNPEAFFRTKLGDIEEPTAPFGLLDVRGDGSRVDEAHQMLETSLAKRIRAQTRHLGVSAATVFHAACALVIAHTSGRTDVVFGSVLLGRFQSSTSATRILGLSINTLPMRLRLETLTATELIQQTQRELVELLNHEQASLALAQRCSGVAGSMPLFTALLNYRHSASSLDALWSPASDIQALHVEGRTNYPVTISVDDLEQEFSLTVQTDPRIDAHRMTAYLYTAIQSLVEALAEAPQTQALALSVVPDSERNQLIQSFNATQETYPHDKLVHELFEEEVQRSSAAIALSYEGESLTYSQLNCKANQLARYLRGRGVGPDQLVAIFLERGTDMVVGLLAALKAGGAYLPLDPNYPVERLHYMLEDAAPRVVLTHEKLISVLPTTQAEVIMLDHKTNEIAAHLPENISAAGMGLSSGNLVYVIYTSGSTGQPKGTTMAHQSMVNLIEWHRRTFRGCEAQRVLQFAALSFDVAFQETFSTLCTGGTLVLLDDWVRRDARALMEFVSRQSIQRLFLPPLMLQGLAECFKDDPPVASMSLRDVITAGEQLRITPEIARFFKHLQGCRLHDHYGPTETHVVTSLTLKDDPDEWPTLPAIGRPISNARICVLDRQGQAVAIGVIGEIYIGGANVARGYLQRPELTAQRFLPDRFCADAQRRLYKTGDLGRWRADGILEYVGRNDEQVKIRGFRIELGEIEAQLARCKQIREAAVVVREELPGDKRIVAYVTSREQRGPSTDDLRAQLKATLPEYMVPSAFIYLENLPLTPSGKLDRRALPPPEPGAYASTDYESPRGELEQELARIWQELLGVDRVGRQDDFFDLGGHSLVATRVITHVSHLLGVDLPLRVMFEKPTIEGLSMLILEKIRAEVSMEAQWQNRMETSIQKSGSQN